MYTGACKNTYTGLSLQHGVVSHRQPRKKRRKRQRRREGQQRDGGSERVRERRLTRVPQQDSGEVRWTQVVMGKYIVE